ncbi:MAG: DUF4437 domain-containing protein [Ignavibacteriae bacterium]|nr:DUF4437 domain-containing protein [Ignavibacteria bacterium]MBI3363779.1 DUF4437 domain-containing protein [Ignavibacteriota bacterium]
MKRFSSLFILLIATLMVLGATQSIAQKKTKKEATVWPAENLTWVEVPNTGGVKRAVLWGDPDKGAYGAFYKFPAGAKFPLHYHTNPIKTVVISGTMFYTPEGGTETKLGPGSYLSYGAKDRHASGAVGDSGCTFLCQQPGKFDLVPIEEKK